MLIFLVSLSMFIAINLVDIDRSESRRKKE